MRKKGLRPGSQPACREGLQMVERQDATGGDVTRLDTNEKADLVPLNVIQASKREWLL